MSNPGPIKDNRELLANLKQDAADVRNSAAGKLATTIAQHQGADEINRGGAGLLKSVEPSGEVDRDAIQQSLEARAYKKMEEETGGDTWKLEKGTEAARLQSAAEQYSLGRQRTK